MSEITKDLIDFLIAEVKTQKPLGEKQLYSDDQCLEVALRIIKANFPICVNKMVKGEKWEL